MSNNIKIENFVISQSNRPFIIAEMSGNHNQSLERALAIVDAAADAGAHAIKLQTYTADTMTVRGAYKIEDSNSLWNGRELYDLYREAYTPWEWHTQIFKKAQERGLIAFSSPFDESAVDFLEKLGAPLYKIASFENTDHTLLRRVAKTGKPIIMSTGVSTIADIFESVQVLKTYGCKDLVLLKCTSTYPASPENTNLLTIPVLQQIFSDCVIGLSDHTMGVGASVGAVTLGARVIEKHFTLKRADGGVDSAFSLEPDELKSLVIESERAFLALGIPEFGVIKAEDKSKKFKRSVYVVEDIKNGDLFTKENLKVIRPGDGLEPRFYDQLLGKKSNRNIAKGTPMSFDLLF
ncbi:MAG: pseudaminic acid synthase [Cyclobacteriaceae bacterium]|nr:pseudaminic acid synthase [Cyclobacteriaceae bacterium]